jgi:hypothetical protein
MKKKTILNRINCTIILMLLLATLIQMGYAQNKPSLERVAVISLKGPVGGDLNQMAYSNKHKHLFLANKSNTSLDVIDVQANQVFQELKEDIGGSGVDYAPDREWAFIAEGKVCNVYEYKDNQYQLLKAIPANGCSKVRYNADDQRIYLMGRIKDKRYLSVHDANTFEHLFNIDIPGRFSVFEIDRKREKIFLNGHNAIYKVDIKDNVLEATFPIDAARGFKPIAFDEENNRVFLATRKKPQVVVFDGETGKEIASVDIKGDMDNISYDPIHKRIYAACGEGFISVVQQVDADTYTFFENIPTKSKARVAIYSPGMDLFFLGVRQMDDMKGPELWVYKPK